MILASVAGGSAWRLITQPDHAFFAAELLRLWRGDGLPEHPRRDDLLFATREHDNGWREVDASPSVDPRSGAPRDFLTTPPELRREIWERGTARYVRERPYAALLIIQHAQNVLRDVATHGEWAPFFAELADLRRDLVRSTGADEASILADYAWVDLADRISLLACGAEPAFPDASRTVWRRAATGEGRVHLAIGPFPLAGATTFAIPCRIVPCRRYGGDADFAVEAASARWQDLSVAVGDEL